MRIVAIGWVMLVVGAGAEALAQGRAPRGPEDFPETPPLRLPTVRGASLVDLGRPNLVIGSEDEPGPALFGQPGVRLIGPRGEMLVFDAADYTLRVFDSTGTHIQTFGRRGRGPGEFIMPPDFASDGTSRVLVAQWQFGIAELALGVRGLSYVGSFGEVRNYRSLCFLGDHVIGAAWVDGTMLHELDVGGNVVRSWGGSPRNPCGLAARRVP